MFFRGALWIVFADRVDRLGDRGSISGISCRPPPRLQPVPSGGSSRRLSTILIRPVPFIAFHLPDDSLVQDRDGPPRCAGGDRHIPAAEPDDPGGGAERPSDLRQGRSYRRRQTRSASTGLSSCRRSHRISSRRSGWAPRMRGASMWPPSYPEASKGLGYIMISRGSTTTSTRLPSALIVFIFCSLGGDLRSVGAVRRRTRVTRWSPRARRGIVGHMLGN